MVSKALEKSRKIAITYFLSSNAIFHLSSIVFGAFSHDRNFLNPNCEGEKKPLDSKKHLI